jgi:hypothetical protein
VLSGRALHIASKPGQDAEFKNTDFLLRTWLNAYCVRLSHFLVWLGSHYTLTGGSLANLDSRLVSYAVTDSLIAGSR